VTLEISEKLLAKIATAAARALPNECCGLIEGVRDKNGWRVLALHETKNLAENPRAHFLIDPEAHFRLLRDLRGTGREIIGCYHSHPDGEPVPSATDLASAAEEGFLWLIAGNGKPQSLGAFCFRDKSFQPVQLIKV
jgi:proteasome lid subunit RPN8/RPN11